MTGKKKIFIGCSIVALISTVGLLALIAGCFYLAGDPADVTVQVSAPTTAKRDEVMELVIRITNDRSSRAFKVGDIDIKEEYLDGFVVVSADPKYKSSTQVPLVKSQSFTFDISVPAKETKEFKFKLRPVKPGVFKGDVDVYEGLRSITEVVETEIK